MSKLARTNGALPTELDDGDAIQFASFEDIANVRYGNVYVYNEAIEQGHWFRLKIPSYSEYHDARLEVLEPVMRYKRGQGKEQVPNPHDVTYVKEREEVERLRRVRVLVNALEGGGHVTIKGATLDDKMYTLASADSSSFIVNALSAWLEQAVNGGAALPEQTARTFLAVRAAQAARAAAVQPQPDGVGDADPSVETEAAGGDAGGGDDPARDDGAAE